MKRPTILEGAGVALVASLSGGVLFAALSTLFPGGGVLRLVVAVVALGYLLYLLGRSRARIGRVTAVGVWVLVAALLWWWAPPLSLYLAAHLGLVWLVRSLYFHTGPLAALADLGLTALGLAAAAWALLQTHSLVAALWCLFLVQSLFVTIPERWGRRSTPEAIEPDRFQRAHQVAEAAVRRLSAIR